jgi:predicted MFS family arabinose efflux permease
VEEFSPDVRRALRVDVAATLLFALFTGLTNPFTGLFLRRELGATPLQLALLPAATAGCLLLSVAWVRLIDARAPLPYVVWSSFTARALFLLVPFVGSPWSFLGILVAGNLLGTIASPAQACLVEQIYPREQRGRALGASRMAGAILGIVAMPAAGILVALVGYRWVFAGGALAGMAASLWQRRLPVRPRDGGPPERARLGEAWAAVREDRDFRRLLLAMFVFGSGVWIQMPANTLMVADVLAATPRQLGVFAACAAAAALAGNACWGRLVDRSSSLEALRAVFVIGALTPLLYYVARSPWMLAATSVTEALMQSGLDLVWLVVVLDLAGPRRVTPYMAIAGTLAGVRGVVGPLVSAVVIEHAGVYAVYLLSAAAMACGVWLVGRPLRQPRRQPVAAGAARVSVGRA